MIRKNPISITVGFYFLNLHYFIIITTLLSAYARSLSIITIERLQEDLHNRDRDDGERFDLHASHLRFDIGFSIVHT